jgi:hypothetical protein
MFISKIDIVTDQETQALLDAGYQVAVGMLMWAVRLCYPGGKSCSSHVLQGYGTTTLGSLWGCYAFDCMAIPRKDFGNQVFSLQQHHPNYDGGCLQQARSI